MKRFLKFSNFVLAFLIILLTAGCEDEKLSKKELLTDHPWKFEKVETTSSNPDKQNAAVFATGLLLAAGMEWTFYTDGTYTMTATNLQPPESEDGTWELSSDGKILYINVGTQDEEESNIKTLTSDKLVFEMEEWDGEYQENYTTTNTWKR